MTPQVPAPTTGVVSFLAPPFGASHLRAEFRDGRFFSLLPSALRTSGRSSATDGSSRSSLRRFAPTVGVTRRTVLLAPPFGASHQRSEFRYRQFYRRPPGSREGMPRITPPMPPAMPPE